MVIDDSATVLMQSYRRQGCATCIREEVEPLEAELERINATLNNRAMKLTASEAVKWLHDEYSNLCSVLQTSAQKHKLGLGGENVGNVHAEAVDRLSEENAKLRALVQALLDGLHAEAESRYLEDEVTQPTTGPALAAAKEHGFVPTNTTEG